MRTSYTVLWTVLFSQCKELFILVLQTTSPSDLPLVFKHPTSCNVSDCDIYVGIERNAGNDHYLNFYIEGNASSWVAVGFTSTPSMVSTCTKMCLQLLNIDVCTKLQFSADVLACNLDPNGDVEVLSTWNADSGRSNVPDKNMSTFAFSASVEDGRIQCRYDPDPLIIQVKHSQGQSKRSAQLLICPNKIVWNRILIKKVLNLIT